MIEEDEGNEEEEENQEMITLEDDDDDDDHGSGDDDISLGDDYDDWRFYLIFWVNSELEILHVYF